MRAPAPMIAGPAHQRALEPRARLDHDAALDLGVDELALDSRRSTSSRIRRFASSMSSRRPVSFHQPRTMWGSTRSPRSIRFWIASVISSSSRQDGSIARAASKIDGREHVDADQREVGRRLLRLLDQSLDAVAVELGDSVHLGVGHVREQDQRVGLGLRLNASTRSVMPSLSRLSPRYITNGVEPRNVLRRQHRVREPLRLVLLDVGDLDPEARAVAGRLPDRLAGLGGDDDADLLDAGRRHRLEPVEEHRLVGHGHELLGARVRDRAQPRALPTRKNQSLQFLHPTAAYLAGARLGSHGV